MGGELHVEDDVFAAAYANDFVIDGERMPLRIVALVVVALHLLDIEVLNVGIERGESPGDVLVVACDDVGETSERDAGRVIAGGAQIGHVPDVGHCERKMHIVREQRLSAGGVAASNHPVVRAGNAVVAGRLAERRAEGANIVVRGETRLGAIVVILVVRRRRGSRSWLGQVDNLACGWMVAPRSDGIEIRLEPRVVKFLRDALPRELGFEARVERLNHHHADGERVDPRPRLGPVAEERELRWKGIRMLRDEQVHAAGIGVEARAFARWQAGIDALRSVAELEYTLGNIVLNQRGPHDFGKLAIGVAAIGVHLPQAILRRDVALRDEEIFLRGSFDMGNAVRVATDNNWSRESGEMEVAIELGQRCYGY